MTGADQHEGVDIGSVVSAWIDDSQNLNCLVRLHDDSEGS